MTQGSESPRSARWRGWATAAALMLILIGGAAARFIDLETNPGGLYPDEAAEAISARQILRDPSYKPVFVVEESGREALFAYSVAAGFAVAGDSVLTLRTVAALWGVLGVLAIWLLARQFGAGVGLAAAAWAAGSLWLIVISRDGMRNTFVPFFCAIALLALLAWHDRGSRRAAVLAGATLAVATLYTYAPLKLLPLLAVIWILWLRRTDRTSFGRMARHGGYVLASFLLVGAPMIAFALGNPQAYLGRTIGVSAFNPALAAETNLVEHVLRTLGMFAVTGDPNARHDVAGLPLLGWPLVIVAIVGVVVLWRNRQDARHSLILLSLPIFLLPPLLATEGGSPHFLRALGLAAPIAVTIGLGAHDLACRVAAALSPKDRVVSRLPRAVAAITFAALFAVIGISATSTYLTRPEADRRVAFRYDLVAMAEVALPTDAVIASEFDAFTVQYVHDDPQPTIVRPGQPIDDPAIGRVLTVRVEDLRAAVGPERAAGARPVAWDSLGQPTVWAVDLR